jgi:hypothetical protein
MAAWRCRAYALIHLASIAPAWRGDARPRSPCRRQGAALGVERTHSWLNQFRGILIRWTKKPENYLAMLHFALAIITWRQGGLRR